MVNVYWHSLSFTHSHEYIYGKKMSAVIFAVTQQITMGYAGKKKRLFWSKGEMEVPLEFANSCDQSIF